MTAEITPVQDMGGWWAKREDFACFLGHQYPSGAKVRQYLEMVHSAPADAVLMVGCSADSAMQIYVAHAGEVMHRPAYVVVPSRKQTSAATQYALDHHAVVSEVTPGYPSVYRARAKELGKALGRPVVRWDPDYAIADTLKQLVNLPVGAKRVVVPSGSGLTAASILGGLHLAGRSDVKVLAVGVSDLADRDKILGICNSKVSASCDPERLEYVRATQAYGKAVEARLPDGTLLDPYYAAKAHSYIEPGDVLWVSGRRPA